MDSRESLNYESEERESTSSKMSPFCHHVDTLQQISFLFFLVEVYLYAHSKFSNVFKTYPTIYASASWKN